MLQYLGHPACAAWWRGLRQVLQTLAKILFGLTVVEGGRTGLLAELVSRLVHEHSNMSVGGRFQSKKLLQPALPMRRFQQIGAPDHMVKLRLSVINGRGQLVGIETVAALHNKIP